MPGGAPPNLYGSAVDSSLSYAGIDQGVDFTGAGNVYALGDAIVTRVMAHGSGWPGEGAVVNYRILSGPAAGRDVYVAEDLVPLVQTGQHVKAGDPIAKATGSGKAPGIEMGWAQKSGVPLAPRPPARPAPQYTAQGAAFAAFVRSGKAGGQDSGLGSLIPPNPLGPGNILGGGGGPVTQIIHDGKTVVSTIDSIPKFIALVTDPAHILRGLQVIAGAVLVLAGLLLLVRQVALSADLPDPAGVAGSVAGSVDRVPLPGTGRDIYQSKTYAAKGA